MTVGYQGQVTLMRGNDSLLSGTLTKTENVEIFYHEQDFSGYRQK